MSSLLIVLFLILGIVIFISAPILTIRLIRKGIKSNNVQNQAMQIFAQKRGLSIDSKPDKNMLLDKNIVKYWPQLSVKDAIHDQKGDYYKCDLYLGKHILNFFIRRTTLPPLIANFILSPNVGIGEESPFRKDDWPSVKLEGNVSKYFNLKVKPGYETLTLEILSPDVVQWLITNAQSLSIVGTDHYMYLVYALIEQGNLFSAQSPFNDYTYQYDALVKVADYLFSKELQDKTPQEVLAIQRP